MHQDILIVSMHVFCSFNSTKMVANYEVTRIKIVLICQVDGCSPVADSLLTEALQLAEPPFVIKVNFM